MTKDTTVTKEEVATDLSKESKAILENIETMTVLELSKLVKALEDKFGVVASAPAVVIRSAISLAEIGTLG